MRILFASAHPYIPQIAGGAQASTHELALAFNQRGQSTAALMGLQGNGWTGARSRVLLKLTGRAAVVDSQLGYPVYRAWHPQDAVDEVIARFRPDVAFVQSGSPVAMARAFEAAGTPVVAYLRNVESDDLAGDPTTLRHTRFVANSMFTARHYAERFGIEAQVVHPMVMRERYEVNTDKSHVVFINPHPNKGLAIALGVAAALPDIPFAFVKAWDDVVEPSLQAALSRLGNIRLLERTRDMREVYRIARMVLAPSQWEEAFGRIAAEAHVSGIPVIASRRGGLPEAVGPGGVIVDADAPVDQWAAVVRDLWDDPEKLARLSAAARDYSLRPELDSNRQVETLLGILQSAAAGAPVRSGSSS